MLGEEVNSYPYLLVNYILVLYASLYVRETLFDAKQATLADIMSSDSKYIIPRFQRAYSWQKDQIEQFLIDAKEITSHYDGNDKDLEEYFFGSMVFVKTDKTKHYIIVDGQQRLATICIFIAVIRDILKSLNNKEASTEIGNLIVQSSYARNTPLFRIKLSDRNMNYFDNFIMNSGLPQDKLLQFKNPISHNRWIYYAYDRFYNELTNMIEDHSHDKSLRLFNICQSLIRSFKVIEIIVDNKTDAYKLFETLNQRGLDLSITDLIKNHVLDKCNVSDETFIYGEWEDIINIMEKNDLDAFLRHHWMANYDKILKKDALYKEIDNNIDNANAVLDYTTSLRYFAAIYHGFLFPQKEFETWYKDKHLVETLNVLSLLNSKVCYPLLMIARKKYGPNDFKLLANACLKFFFRSKTICDVHATALEKLMVCTANRLRVETLSCDEIINILKNARIYPDDQKFQNSFIGSRIKQIGVAKYILSSLEIELQGNSNFDVSSVNEATFEYIVPETLNTRWTNSDPSLKSEHSNLLYRIGNLTLLEAPQTSTTSALTFDEKLKQVYSKSSFKITSSLTKYAGRTWNADAITQREKDLAKHALNAWKL